MKKITIFIIAILLILLAVFMFSRKSEPNGVNMPTEEMNNNPVSQSEKIIVYNNDGFSPKSLEINKGDIVKFVNNSPSSFWPASSFHPTHANYSVGGGCIGSAFDACKDIVPGDSWQFTFDVEGAHGYHDHLNASNFGTIVVKQKAPTVLIGGEKIEVEIVSTSQAQGQGLSGREGLAENSGMLFVFLKSDYYGFWMKDMKFSIDMIWIDSTGKIVHIERSVAPETYPKVFTPALPASYVLEVVAGFANENGLKIGDFAKLP